MSKEISRNVVNLLLLMLIVLTAAGSTTSFLIYSTSPGYSTGYQGAKAQYCGINYKGTEYTNTDRHSASMARFDTTLAFDPDKASTGECNLIGEMSSVFIPSESVTNTPNWIPSEWQRSIAYMKNPVGEGYEWEIDNKSYVMEEWMLRWYISISAEWDSKPFGTIYTYAEWADKIYTNTEIWFELDLTPVWYFEGAERAYFAIAKLQMADVRKTALDNKGEKQDPDKSMSVSPESQGSILPIYYGRFATQNKADKTAQIYQGKKLNPDLFTDKVYTYISLQHFGTHEWTEWVQHKYKGDVATFAVDVHVFVIGQWDVKDIQSIEQVEGEEGYGRTAKIGGGFSIGDFLSTPEGRLLLVLIAGVIIFLILAIFAPWVLMAIFSLFGSGRKRR